MSKMYKSKLTVGEQTKIAVVINYKGDQELKESVSVDRLHHIHILDRSWSMNKDIDSLIENVKKTLEVINSNDFVSVIWFSGEGENKILIKGAKKYDGMDEILDSIKSCIGATCFSEPLTLVKEIIDDLAVVCPNFSVTLFTDGQPVTSWSGEEVRTLSVVDSWKEYVIALNTIGYGDYYNQEFLRSLSDKTMFGQMLHSSLINDYIDIFSHNYERIEGLCIDTMDLETHSPSEILYLNGKASKMVDTSMSLKMLDKKKNQLIIFADKEFTFTLNGAEYNSESINSPIPKASVTPILYAYAYENFYSGSRQKALDILAKNLGDKYLVDEQLRAFTYDEVSVYMKLLKKAMNSSKGRYIEGEVSNYLPAYDAFCVMDLLKLLTQGDNSYVYAKNYKRTGLKTEDKFNLFEKNDGDIITPFNELTFNKDRLNVSVKSKINGKVKLNPNQAEKVGLDKEIDSYIFRNQTIIKDGTLNLDTIEVIVDDKTNTTLTNRAIKGLIINSKNNRLTLNFSVLPIINRTYLEGSTIDAIFDIICTLNSLEAKQKVLNYYIKKSRETSIPSASKTPATYTAEQLEVLKDHGIDSRNCYVGVEMKQESKDGKDFYLAKDLNFAIKGSASLPSVADVIKKVNSNSKLNANATIMSNYIKELQEALGGLVSLYDDSAVVDVGDFFDILLVGIKQRILQERINLCSGKIAKVLTGDWFENLESDGKGNYQYIKEDKILVVKTNKTKVFYS